MSKLFFLASFLLSLTVNCFGFEIFKVDYSLNSIISNEKFSALIELKTGFKSNREINPIVDARIDGSKIKLLNPSENIWILNNSGLQSGEHELKLYLYLIDHQRHLELKNAISLLESEILNLNDKIRHEYDPAIRETLINEKNDKTTEKNELVNATNSEKTYLLTETRKIIVNDALDRIHSEIVNIDCENLPGIKFLNLETENNTYNIGERALLLASILVQPENPTYEIYLEGRLQNKVTKVDRITENEAVSFSDQLMSAGTQEWKVYVYIQDRVGANKILKTISELEREICLIQQQISNEVDETLKQLLIDKKNKNLENIVFLKRELLKHRVRVQTISQDLIVEAPKYNKSTTSNFIISAELDHSNHKYFVGEFAKFEAKIDTDLVDANGLQENILRGTFNGQKIPLENIAKNRYEGQTPVFTDNNAGERKINLRFYTRSKTRADNLREGIKKAGELRQTLIELKNSEDDPTLISYYELKILDLNRVIESYYDMLDKMLNYITQKNIVFTVVSDLDKDITDEIVDDGLKTLVRQTLGLSENEPITKRLALEITSLESIVPDGGPNILSLEGIENFKNLEWLLLGRCEISDINPLSHFANLESSKLGAVLIESANITDLSPIRNIISLGIVSFVDNPISDITPLLNLTNMFYLNIHTMRLSVDDCANILELRSRDPNPFSESVEYDNAWKIQVNDLGEEFVLDCGVK